MSQHRVGIGLAPVLPQDVSVLARMLFASALAEREALCRTVFDGARQGQAHLHRTGRLHPLWGNGSLEAASRALAGRGPTIAPEPLWDNADYLSCLELVLQHLRRQ